MRKQETFDRWRKYSVSLWLNAESAGDPLQLCRAQRRDPHNIHCLLILTGQRVSVTPGPASFPVNHLTLLYSKYGQLSIVYGRGASGLSFKSGM